MHLTLKKYIIDKKYISVLNFLIVRRDRSVFRFLRWIPKNETMYSRENGYLFFNSFT